MTKQHFVKSVKRGKTTKVILFCDNVSASVGFGFKIRKYANGTRTLKLVTFPSLRGGGKPYTSKVIIPIDLYAGIIDQLKSKWFIYNKTT